MYDQQPLLVPQQSPPNTNYAKTVGAVAAIGAAATAIGYYAGQGVAYVLIQNYPGSGSAILLALLAQTIPFVLIIVTAAAASLGLTLFVGQKGSKAIATGLAGSLFTYLLLFIMVALSASIGIRLSNVVAGVIAAALTFPVIYLVFTAYEQVKLLPVFIITAGIIGSLILPATLSELADRASVTNENRGQQNSIAGTIVSQPLQATASLDGYSYQPLRLSTGPYDLQSAEGSAFARDSAYLYATYESPRNTIEINQTENAQWIDDFIAIPKMCDINILHGSFATKARGTMGPYFQSARCSKLGTTGNGRTVYGSLKPGQQRIILPYFYVKIDSTVVVIKISEEMQETSDPSMFNTDQKDDILNIVESLEPVVAGRIVL